MFTLAAWLHDLDPFVFRLTETFGVRWYGLSYVAGFVIAWFILVRLARRGLIRVTPEAVGDLMVAIIVGTLAGGRLGYIAFYRPDLLWSFTASPPWWGVLAINEGGMASHGGMIGIVIACWLFSKKNKVHPLHTMDLFALVAPFGVLLGRLANFINGELLGAVVAAPGAGAPWWSVRFPQELLEEKHAPALSDQQSAELVALVTDVAGPDQLNWGGLSRVIAALQGGDASVAARLEPLLSARHASQLYQAFAEGIIVGAIVWIVWAKPRKPGVLTATFLIAYGVGRVITEFWRLPDAHLAVQRIAGLSRGQWLSVAMVVIGAGLAWFVAKKSRAERIGGWRSAPGPDPSRAGRS